MINGFWMNTLRRGNIDTGLRPGYVEGLTTQAASTPAGGCA